MIQFKKRAQTMLAIGTHFRRLKGQICPAAQF